MLELDLRRQWRNKKLWMILRFRVLFSGREDTVRANQREESGFLF